MQVKDLLRTLGCLSLNFPATPSFLLFMVYDMTSSPMRARSASKDCSQGSAKTIYDGPHEGNSQTSTAVALVLPLLAGTGCTCFAFHNRRLQGCCDSRRHLRHHLLVPFNGTAAAHSRQRRRHVLAQRLRRPSARAQQVSRRATVADTPRRYCCCSATYFGARRSVQRQQGMNATQTGLGTSGSATHGREVGVELKGHCNTPSTVLTTLTSAC